MPWVLACAVIIALFAFLALPTPPSALPPAPSRNGQTAVPKISPVAVADPWKELQRCLIAEDFERAVLIANQYGSTAKIAEVKQVLNQTQWHARSRKDPTFLHSFALVLREGGVNNLAAVYFRNAIDVKAMKDPVPIDLATWACEAAANAMEMEDSGGALLFLRDAERLGNTWMKDEAAESIGEVEAYAKDPDDIDSRIRFANGFWAGTSTGLSGAYYGRAIEMLTATLKRPYQPTDDQRQAIYRSLIEFARRSSQFELAKRYTGKLYDEFPGTEKTAESLIEQGESLLAGHCYADAKQVLETVLNGEARYDPTQVVRARLDMATALHHLGDDEGMVAQLRRVADTRVSGPSPRAMRADISLEGYRQVALASLADHLKQKKDFTAALALYRTLKPMSGCGNGMDQITYERELHIAECLVGLGKTQAAWDEHIMPQLVQGDRLYQDARLPALAVSIASQQGKLDAFVNSMKVLSSRPGSLPDISVTLGRLEQLKRDGKVNPLAHQPPDE